MKILPAFAKKNITVIISTDNNYAPYVSVLIASIKAHASKEHNYDIIILDSGLTDTIKEKLSREKQANLSIRFYNMKPYIEKFKSSFYLCHHYTIAVYYRFFISEILSGIDKAIYLDCDLIVNEDIANLYNQDIKEKWIGAVQDLVIPLIISYYSPKKEYLKNILQLKDIKSYFNSGVMLINTKEFNKNGVKEKLLKKLEEIKTPEIVDQDILNSVCQGHVHYISNQWNYDRNAESINNRYSGIINRAYTQEQREKYETSKEKFKIFHFAGGDKPWKNPNISGAEYFWHYARKTPFYEEILYRNLKVAEENIIKKNEALIRDIANYSKDKIKYYRYKLLSLIMIGKKRKKYKQKRKTIKAKLKQIKYFLKHI